MKASLTKKKLGRIDKLETLNTGGLSLEELALHQKVREMSLKIYKATNSIFAHAHQAKLLRVLAGES